MYRCEIEIDLVKPKRKGGKYAANHNLKCSSGSPIIFPAPRISLPFPTRAGAPPGMDQETLVSPSFSGILGGRRPREDILWQEKKR